MLHGLLVSLAILAGHLRVWALLVVCELAPLRANELGHLCHACVGVLLHDGRAHLLAVAHVWGQGTAGLVGVLSAAWAALLLHLHTAHCEKRSGGGGDCE